MPLACRSPKSQELEANLRRMVGQALQKEVPILLEIPKIRTHGDLSTPAALQLASVLHKPPLEIANELAQKISELLKGSPLAESIERVQASPPGFVNFFFSPAFLYCILQEVLDEGARYGRRDTGKGKKALVEFVSANPTGPLSVAHGRQAAVGDALANLLDFDGYQVSREYYLNDEGTQIELLAESVLVRAREAAGEAAAFPENGYKGSYVAEAGRKLLAKEGKKWLAHPRAKDVARRFAVLELTQVIRGELDRLGVTFDRWYPQSRLARFGFLNGTLDLLKRRGYLYESEGAWWLKSTDFGDDKDRVVKRSDGRLTYIASDIAYHRRKLKMGYQLLVNLWGPDHHGYIARLKAAVAAMGYDPKVLQIRIVQLCTLKRGAQTIPMSTREGQFITVTQVMDEVGADAARFFFLLRKSDAPLEFDLELAKKQSLENPVYYIQYAHARISSIFANEKKWGAEKKGGPAADHKLTAPEEMAILRLLREFPGVIDSCAQSLEPFGLVSFAQELAESFHRFYDKHRVLSDDQELSLARLRLVRAVQTVLGIALRLLGVSAPSSM